ncbi:MAG: CvpA family protein [Candidatus Omnitrophica bacterium]|nr:CvpA family protein [Candidatus Omnitrophota bacterium]
MLAVLNRVNWVDIFALILLLRISYISSRIGVGIQILPLISLVLILAITLYNYAGIATFFVNKLSMASSTCNFFSYLFMALIFAVIYRVVLRSTGMFLAMGEAEAGGIEKVGGAILGILRSNIILGLVMIGLLLIPIKPIEESVKNSYSGLFFVKTNLDIYSFTMNLVLGRDKASTKKTLSQLLSKKESYIFEKFDLKDKSRFFNKEY